MVRPGSGLFATGILLVACSPPERPPTAEAPVPAYEVTYEADAPDLIRVTAHLPEAPSRLEMTEQGAHQLADGWAHFVSGITLRTEAGNPLPVVKSAPRSWDVDVPAEASRQPVVLTYAVRLAHDSVEWPGGIDGAALALPWGAYFTGRAVFVLPGAMDGPVHVRFRTSPGWSVLAPWPETDDGSAAEYVASTATALTEAYVFAGDFHRFTVDRGAYELAFALGGPSVVARENHFRALADSAFDYYIALMNGPPRTPSDEGAARILVIINEADVTDGEVIGSDINILLARNPDAFGRFFSTFGFVHELFHLWNGKSIRPAGPDDWFTEGLTNYYALKALHQAGDLTDEQFFGLLGDMLYGRYVTDDGYGRLSPRDAVEDKDGHWGLVYVGGMFAGLCLDAQIRLATGERRSLDDVMRAMFERFGGSTDEFGLEDVAVAVRQVGGFDPAPFLERHVEGAQPIPVARCLADFGLDARVSGDRLVIARPAGVGEADAHRIEGLLGRLD